MQEARFSNKIVGRKSEASSDMAAPPIPGINSKTSDALRLSDLRGYLGHLSCGCWGVAALESRRVVIITALSVR
jgi:hypothetical protein